MFIVVAGSGCHGLESIEDQVSADIDNVIKASKPDLMARGVAIDLLQIAKRVGPQCEVAEYKNLSGGKPHPFEGAIQSFGDTVELSIKTPMSVSKPADLG